MKFNPDLPADEPSPSSSEGKMPGHQIDPSGMVRESSARQMKELGVTPLARQLNLTEEQTNGHWCSRCQGIWYGYTLETQCPVCGNRRG